MYTWSALFDPSKPITCCVMFIFLVQMSGSEKKTDSLGVTQPKGQRQDLNSGLLSTLARACVQWDVWSLGVLQRD